MARMPPGRWPNDPWEDYFGDRPARPSPVDTGPVYQPASDAPPPGPTTPPPGPTTPPPGPTTPSRQATGGLEGFDWAKLGTGATSPKYAFAQFAGGQPTTLQALQSFWPQLQAAYSQYFKPWRVQGDRIVYDPSAGALNPAFGGVTSFDVLRGAAQGGLGWQWLPQVPGGGPATPTGGDGGDWPEWLRMLLGGRDVSQQTPQVQQAVDERAWDALRQLLAGMSATPPSGTVPPLPTPPAVQPPRGEADRRQASAAPAATALAALAAAMSAPQVRAPAPAPAPAPSIAPSAITVPAPEVPWMQTPSAPVGAPATAGGAPGMENWALPAGQPPMPLPVFYGLPWALQQALLAALGVRG